MKKDIPAFPDVIMAAVATLVVSFMSTALIFGVGYTLLIETPKQLGFLCQDEAREVSYAASCPSGAQGTLHKAGDGYILFCVCPR